MFEKEAEEYQIANYDYGKTDSIADAFQDGAEFGYNKAKKEMQAQIEKMKCCYNCQKDCGSIDRRICFDNNFKYWELRR